MKILHYANYGSPYKGNFVQSLLKLNEFLKLNNNKMYWMFEDNVSKYAWPEDLKKSGIDIQFINAFDCKRYQKIREYIVKNKIDIVHIHFVTLKVLITFNLALRGLKNVKLCVHLHNHLPHTKAALRRNLLRKANFVCCSQSVADSALAFGMKKDKVFVVENAIDFSRLDRTDNSKNLTEMFNNDKYKLLLFGFDYDRKGVDIVLNAVSPLANGDFNIQLYISVAANLETVKNRITEHFSYFPEWITLLPPCNEVATYYKNTDAFISASREEGFCYALIEAAYCETEVIASKIPAQGDLDIMHCHWFKTEDSNELKEIIKDVYSKKRNSAELTEQKEQVVKKYDLNVWAESVCSIYKKLIGG